MRRLLMGALLGLLAAAPSQAAGPGVGPARSVAIDPLHAQTVYAVGLAGLRRSDDGGATFRRVPLPPETGGVDRVVAVAGAVFAGSLDIAHRSANGGATWTEAPIYGDQPIRRSPVDPATVVAVGRGEPVIEQHRASRATGGAADGCTFLTSRRSVEPTLVVSRDGGSTWAPIPRPPVAGELSDFVLAGGGLIVVLDVFDSPAFAERVFRTSDLGVHWTEITAGWPAPSSGLAADAVVPARLWIHRFAPGSSDQRLLRSDDLGTTWTDAGLAPGDTPVPTAAGIMDLRAAFPCRPFAATTEGPGLSRSLDGGGTFNDDIAGLPERAGITAYDRVGAVEAIATGYGLFHRSGDGPWVRSLTPLGPGVVRDLVSDGRRLYAGTPDGAYISRDGGRHWAAVPGVPAHADVSELAAANGRVAVGVEAPVRAVYAGRSGSNLVRVAGFPVDGAVRGLAFEPSGSLLVATGNRLLRLRRGRLGRVHLFGRTVRGLAVTPNGRILAAVASRTAALLTSDDRGRTFSGRQVSLGGFPRVYAAGRRGFYVDDASTIAYSRDGRRLTSGLGPTFDIADSHARIAVLPGAARIAWLAGDEGILRTHDGQAWQPVDGSPGRVTAVVVSGKELVYATLDKGVGRLPLVVGDLTIPRITAHYDAATRSVVGRVIDRRAGRALVIVRGAATAAGCASILGDAPAVAADGTFRFRFPHRGRCHRWRFRIHAIDRAGNVSPDVRLATP